MTDCGVHPGPHTTDDPVGINDLFEVPVFVRHSSPLAPQRRPRPWQVWSAAMPWPRMGIVPPDGEYTVQTSWREVLHAALTVGRDVTPWLAATPRLAAWEILARQTPLRSYLSRRAFPCPDGTSRWGLVTNDVYQRGTEITARGAFSYRIGMTMAEWLCWGRLGMSHSLHAETSCPPAADPEQWRATASKPDLIGVHPQHPADWVIEAKAQRRLSYGKLKEGAKQLDLDGLIDTPHRRVLCGTSLEDRLFMTVDIDTRTAGPTDPTFADDPPPGPDPAHDDHALYHLARASMLIFLILRAAVPEQMAVVPVGPAADPRRTPGVSQRSGPVTLLEHDHSTEALRARVRRDDPRQRSIRDNGGIDMLTTEVPGAGLTVGMSRRLYAACQQLVDLEAELAGRASDIAARRISDMALPHQGDGLDTINEEHFVAYRDLEQEFRTPLLSSVRRGFILGEGSDWRRLTDVEPLTHLERPAYQMEAATADTYLALDGRTFR